MSSVLFHPVVKKNKVRRLCGSFFLSPKSSERRSSNGLLSLFLPVVVAVEVGRQSHWPLKMAQTYRYVSMPLTSFDVIRDLLDRMPDSSHSADYDTRAIISDSPDLTCT